MIANHDRRPCVLRTRGAKRATDRDDEPSGGDALASIPGHLLRSRASKAMNRPSRPPEAGNRAVVGEPAAPHLAGARQREGARVGVEALAQPELPGRSRMTVCRRVRDPTADFAPCTCGGPERLRGGRRRPCTARVSHIREVLKWPLAVHLWSPDRGGEGGPFKALSHSGRVRILELLAEGERTIGQLATGMRMELSHLSQQVTVLRRAGVVDSRRVKKHGDLRAARPADGRATGGRPPDADPHAAR